MKRIITYIPVIIAAAAAFASANVTFTANADRLNAAAGDKITVVARLSTPKAVSAPHPAPTPAFDLLNINTGQSQSHSVRMVNGQIEQTREINYSFIYTISVNADGQFTFPALTVNIDGRDYSTRPIQFNAGGAAGGQGGASGQGGQSSAHTGGAAQQQRGTDITASLAMSKRTLFPGEQAILTLKVMQRAGSPIQTQRGYNGAIEQIEKAFGKEFSLNRLFTNQITQGQERINGEMYNTFSLRYAVFGLTAGEYAIPGITFEYDEIQRSNRRVNPFFGDFFDMDFFGGSQAIRRSTRTAPLTITVKPQPSNAPAGYAGSVGKFTITATAEPPTVPAGEAVTLRITLRGNTRASSIGDPMLPEFKNCDVFPPERQTAVDTGAGGLSARKTYRYLIIPKREGELKLGPITYTYLDPESGAYKTASADPPAVAVTPGQGVTREQTRRLTQEEIQQVGQDIRYIKLADGIRHESARPYREPHWYLLFPLPFLLFLFALVYKLQSKRSDENIVKSIRQKALSNAVRELNKISRGGTDNEFLGKTSAVIEKYISNKFAFPATGRTLEELKDELLSRRIDVQTVDGLTALIENINEHRFGGKAFNAQGRSELVDKTIKFLSSMEKTLQKRKTQTIAAASSAMMIVSAVIGMTAMFPAPAFASASGVEVNALFQQAGVLYAAGEYDSAVTLYTQIVEKGIGNSSVFFNLGNSYYRLEKPGLARLYYEKAAILAPADPDIEANIRFVKSVIVDRSEDHAAQSDDFLSAVFYGIHTLLPLGTQLVILFALTAALSVLGSMMLVKRGLARLWLGYGAALCALFIITVGTSAGYKIYTLENKQYAIILTPSIDAKNQPRGDQTLFTAHEGTKLQIRKTMGDWSLVSLSNGASGWVTTSSLGRI